MNTKKLYIPLVLSLALLALVGVFLVLAAGGDAALAAGPIPNPQFPNSPIPNPQFPNSPQSTTRYVASTGNDSGNSCASSANPCATVQHAVDQAQAGDEIRVAAGNYTGVQARAGVTQTVFISKSLTLRGGYTTANWNSSDPQAHPTTLDATGGGRVFYLIGPAAVTLEGLNVTGGVNQNWWESGGGVYVEDATIVISRCRVYSNTTGGIGGGLFAYGSTVTLTNSTIDYNQAEFAGGMDIDGGKATLSGNIIRHNEAFDGSAGGIYLDNDGVFALTDNLVISNTASNSAGGIYVQGTSRLISNTISGNRAAGHEQDTGDGGGLFVGPGDHTLTSNTVGDNYAEMNGGGLCAQPSLDSNTNITMTGNTISGNTAKAYGNAGWPPYYYGGGGLYLDNCNATLHDNIIRDNQVRGSTRDSGGGLNAQNSRITLAGNQIISNTTSDAGGGVYLRSNDALTLTGNTVTSNTATGYGGGMYLGFNSSGVVTIVLSGNTVSTNTAHQDGGGMYLTNNDVITMTGNTLGGNIASGDGGGVYLGLSYGPATLARNTVVSNTANGSGGGGGLYLQSNDAILTGNTVSDNAATGGDGGGLYLNYSDSALRDNTFAGNVTSNNGGGLYLSGSGAALDGNEIVGNRADGSGILDGGGGLYLASSGAVLIGNTVSRNATAHDGGGFYLYSSDATLQANAIVTNIASGAGGGAHLYEGDNAVLGGNTVLSNTADNGGGLCLHTSDATLRNNVIAENHAATAGSGIYIYSSAPELLYTTIANNGNSDGAGLYVTGSSSAPALVNTILVSQTVGITATAYNAATLDGVLWHGNGANTGGGGTITVTHDLSGAPAFANPAGGDYHILSTSAAVDSGVANDYPLDIDGDYRPLAAPPDLGADEIVTTTPPCQARLNGSTYATVQEAINAGGAPTDLVEVSGVCTDTVDWNGGTYVAVLTKTLTLRGGYSTDFSAWNPDAYPTLLNGLWRGGVLALDGAVSPTVEYLTLLSGQATEGGGLWSNAANPALRHLEVTDNVAGLGGGVMLRGAGGRLECSQVTDNRAAHGGGVYLLGSGGTVLSNTIQNNTATGDFGGGGGLHLEGSAAAVLSNTVSGNTALGSDGGGGGLYLHGSHNATLSGNTIRDNLAEGGGGGVRLDYSKGVLISGNTVQSNTAQGIINGGGGLYLDDSDLATISGNDILSNTAQFDCGGVMLYYSDDALLSGNVVRGNVAGWDGGGMYLFGGYDATTLVNNVVAGNRIGAAYNGSGVRVEDSTGVYMLHTTIHGNSGGDGSGVYVTEDFDSSSVWMINTIVTSQTVGIYVSSGNTATLESTLWGDGDWVNGSDWGGTGVINTSHDYHGEPLFVNPDSGDYHIAPGSAAIDAGVDAGVTSDIDGQHRPYCAAPDLGADEYPWGVALTGVTIAAPTTGMTNTTYTFTAAASPISATQPVTYTWQETDKTTVAHLGGVSDTIQFDWGLTGTKTITVTAANACCGGVSATHTIAIGVEERHIYLPLVLRNFAP